MQKLVEGAALAGAVTANEPFISLSLWTVLDAPEQDMHEIHLRDTPNINNILILLTATW